MEIVLRKDKVIIYAMESVRVMDIEGRDYTNPAASRSLVNLACLSFSIGRELGVARFSSS